MKMEIKVKKEIPKWKEKSTFEKGLTVVGLLLSIVVILFAGLSLAGRLPGGMNIAQPILGLLMLTQTLQLWKYNRPVAIFSLIVAIFIFCVSIIIFFFR